MISDPVEEIPEDLNHLRAIFAPKQTIAKLRFKRLRRLIESPKRPLTEADLRRMYKLRHGSERLADINTKIMNYDEIAEKLHIPRSTVHYALRRYENQGCQFINLRRFNWRKAWITNTKIKGMIKEYLLSHKTLTEWAGKSLIYRVNEIRANLGLKITPRTLSRFYRNNKVSYVVVKYQYQQATRQNRAKVRQFVLQLARRIKENQNIIYFDETSCNQWLRTRMTWSARAQPVKMHLNQNRGKGVTVLGAIGMHMSKPVFSLAKSTNEQEVLDFFLKLHSIVNPNPSKPNLKTVIVLDNHRAHKTKDIANLASQLGFELLFQPPYCPEINSIESLWSIVKKDVKTKLLELRENAMSTASFKQLMLEALGQVTPLQAQYAARYNNRAFIHQILNEFKQPELLTDEEIVFQQRIFDAGSQIQSNDSENNYLTPLAGTPRNNASGAYLALADLYIEEPPEEQQQNIPARVQPNNLSPYSKLFNH